MDVEHKNCAEETIEVRHRIPECGLPEIFEWHPRIQSACGLRCGVPKSHRLRPGIPTDAHRWPISKKGWLDQGSCVTRVRTAAICSLHHCSRRRDPNHCRTLHRRCTADTVVHCSRPVYEDITTEQRNTTFLRRSLQVHLTHQRQKSVQHLLPPPLATIFSCRARVCTAHQFAVSAALVGVAEEDSQSRCS